MKTRVVSVARGVAVILASALPAAWLGAAESVSAEPIIELPKYVIQDTRELPPPEAWRLAGIPGFEILSCASSDTETERLLKGFQSFKIAFNAVWKQADPPSSVPVSIILCGRNGSFDIFKPDTKTISDQGMASVTYRKGEQAAIILDMQAKVINLAVDNLNEPATGQNADVRIDHYKQLYREYIKYIMSRSEPRPPAWMIEGIAQIAMRMKFEPTAIILGSVEDPRKQSSAATLMTTASEDLDNSAVPDAEVEDTDFNLALQRHALIPWDKFFTISHDSPEALNPIGNNRWAKQSYAFVHMCMYGRGKRYQEGFLKFVDRASTEPITEAMFKECFGIGYNKMLSVLRGYIDFTDYKYERFNVKSGQLPTPVPLALRDASDAEVGRIKGEALVLAGHLDSARIAFLAPYVRGERDPNLLAAFGLFEHAGQRDDKARKLLEGAAAGKTTRARAYLTLGSMRLAEGMKTPDGAGGKLSSKQTISVLEAAFEARAHPPARAGTYELIADTWLSSAAKPKREHLAVLNEGILKFPTDSVLLYKTASLKLQSGFLNDAVPLIEMGLETTKDPVLKESFGKLQVTAAELTKAKTSP